MEDEEVIVTEPAAGEETVTDPDTVPVSVVQAIRGELQGLKGKLEELEDENLILKSTLRNQGSTGGAQNNAAPAVHLNDPLAGLDDDDVPTAGQVKRTIALKEAQMAEALQAQKLMAKPDFDLILREHWPAMLKADPELQQEMAGMSKVQAAAFAYRIGKTDPAYIAKKAAAKVAAAEGKTKDDTKNRPRSPASVGSSAATATQADLISGMNDKEFAEYRRKLARG